MKETITQGRFERIMEDVRPGSFSQEALSVLFDFLEGMEDETGEEYELDPVELDSNWSELTVDEALQEFADELAHLVPEEDFSGLIDDDAAPDAGDVVTALNIPALEVNAETVLVQNG